MAADHEDTAHANDAGRHDAGSIDWAGAVVYALPLHTRFRGITEREGMLLRGPAGWGEFCPFLEYDDATAAAWLATAIEQCLGHWPPPVRETIPVNATVPAVAPATAREMVVAVGCATAKVKVAEPGEDLEDDLSRVAAVREALGAAGAIRVDANAAWDVAEASRRIPPLNRAAGGLEYVEQPCATLAELAAVRRRVGVPIAADESIRTAEDPLRVALAEAADVAVLKASPLGGARRALRVAEAAGLACVVSSALETSVGLGAGLALAAALPRLDYACGLATAGLLAGDVVAEGDAARAEAGWLPVPRAPVAPDPQRLAGAASGDPDRRAWWHARLARARELLDQR